MTTSVPAEIIDTIRSCPRGCYQEALLDGREAWSGATIRGRAWKYGAHYHRSRVGLVRRANAALRHHGWSASTALVLRGGRWHRDLVLVAPTGTIVPWISAVAS